MNLRAVLFATALVSTAPAAPAAAWTAVPGAPDVAIDLASLHLERSRVTVWMRWWGRPAGAPELPVLRMRCVRVNSTALRTEFDCGGRTMRKLATHAYYTAGSPGFMSSVPGPMGPVVGQEAEWTYDAACEAARTGGRF